MATKGKDAEEKAPDATEGSDSESNGGDPEGGPKKPNVWAKYRSEIRIAVIGAFATVLIASIFAPVRGWTGGAFDSVHDYFRGFDGKRLDDMKETIEDRPFWQEGPSFADGAFEYVGESDVGGPIVSTLGYDSTRARAIGVDELVNNAPNLKGEPVILVGRVVEETTVEPNGYIPFIADEVVLAGNERYAYVGTDEYGIRWKGIAAYVGILVATGQALHDEAPAGVSTAYFVGVDSISVNPDDPALRRELEALAPEEFR